jgi:trans-2,3-dihydro-3-hydroxyanthranilate isomerase
LATDWRSVDRRGITTGASWEGADRVDDVARTFRFVVVDVFTDVPFAGNQLAVFTDAREIPEDMLQPLAREINFSETVFVYPPQRRDPATQQRSRGGTASPVSTGHENDEETVFVYPADGDGHARMRIFTPLSELAFAGHPVLGTAFVLAGPLQLDELRLETGQGIVEVRLAREGARIAFGWMAQPAATVAPFDRSEELLAVLGVESELPVELYDNGVTYVYVGLPDESAVSALRPDFARIAGLVDHGVSCFAGEGSRWKMRMFAPGVGVPEDPATGSAAGPLALHLARHGRIGFGDEIEIAQGVEVGRPSTLHAVARSPDEIEVGGSAVVVARGEFRL